MGGFPGGGELLTGWGKSKRLLRSAGGIGHPMGSLRTARRSAVTPTGNHQAARFVPVADRVPSLARFATRGGVRSFDGYETVRW